MISLLISLGAASGTGYTPTSDMTEHMKIDMDQKAMETHCDAFEWDKAIEIYSKGKNSKKSSGIRTLQGFSTSMKEGRPKLRGEPYYDMYAEYWLSPTYADDFVMAALEGKRSFSMKPGDTTNIVRSEAANKGAQYQVTWQYVVHELEDSVQDCAMDDETGNDRGVKAWDEGWAFWTGSLEEGGCKDGMGGYMLAQRRCQNYGTCVKETGCSAKSNENMLAIFKGPQAGCSAGPSRNHVDCIVKEMTVPLIQGSIRYAYKCSTEDDKTTANPNFYKSWSEGWAFLAAVLPQIDRCDKCAAALVRQNMDAGITPAMVMTDGYEKFRDAIRSTYDCLGITCEDIGPLGEASAVESEAKCGDESKPECPKWTVAGYVTVSDVVEHAKIDLDQKVVETTSDAAAAAADTAAADAEWAKCEAIYTTGENSRKSSSLRTLKGFSTATKDGQPKLAGEPWYEMYVDYWGSSTYADDYVMSAIQGTGDFEGKKGVMRAEAANKGSQYQNTWMYVIHELEDARLDCEKDDATNNDRGVKAVDEGWMFFTGSLEGVDGCGSGYGVYELAQKRAKNFGTCHYNNKCCFAAANSAQIPIYETMRAGCHAGPTRDQIDEVVKLMTIPLIQGSIRYGYKLFKHSDHTTDKFAKEWGEGWAFLAAVIPQIAKCDADAAKVVRDNMDAKTAVENVMKDGYEKYRDALRSTYNCLGVTCADIGALDSAVEGGVASESECTCDKYKSGCTPPEKGSDHWWTIKPASDYAELVKPTQSACSPAALIEAIPAADDHDHDHDHDSDDDSDDGSDDGSDDAETTTSSAGVLSLLLMMGSM